MDKDRIKGSVQNIKGKAKEAMGDLTGDAKLQAEGRADQVAGKTRNAFGSAKDALRDASKR